MLQADPMDINSYIYQQSLPKNKEIFLWILRKPDTKTKTSRPYYQLEPTIIPLESAEPLQDPREVTTSLSDENRPITESRICHISLTQ